MFKTVIALTLLCAVASASRTVRPKVSLAQSDRVIVETFKDKAATHITPSYGWREDGAKVNPLKKITLTFAIKHRNTAMLQKLFYQVSNPRDEHYKNYLSQSGINSLFAPSAQTVSVLTQWLLTSGVSEKDITRTSGGEFVKARMPVATAERLLETQFKSFSHPDGAKALRALRKYTLPRAVAEVVDFVGGVHRFPNRMMINTPQLEDLHRVPLPKSPKKNWLPGGNAPISLSLTGAGPTVTAFFLPRCSPGGAPTDPKNLCGAGPSEGSPIAFIDVTQISEKDNTTTVFSIPASKLNCAYCGQFGPTLNGVCNITNVQFNLTASQTPYCLVNVEGVAPFKGYTYQLTTVYQGSTASGQSVLSNKVINHPWIDAERLYQLYNVHTTYTSATATGTDQAVAEFLGQFYSPTDLSTWFSLFGISGQTVAGLVGPNDASNPGGEATLDIEYIMGMAPQNPTYFWSFAGAGQNPDNQEPFLEWMTYLTNQTSPPKVHSISYADQEDELTPDYMIRIDQEFQKAGLRGITLIFSAGDDGAGGVDLRNKTYQCTRFSPSFPPSSPSVTAVGGTQLSDVYKVSPNPITSKFTQYGVPVTADQQAEVVSATPTGSRITTGGGFSDVFPTAPYQVDEVQKYVSSGAAPASNWYNASGRAYPDVAAMATNYIVYLGGAVVPIGGTSASAPVIASLVTLLNTALANQGKPPLGFLNQMIYSAAQNTSSAFNDITLGDNACSVYPDQCCPVGFNAAPGWDATTGWGTPVFSTLHDLVLGQTPPSGARSYTRASAVKETGNAAWKVATPKRK